MNMLDLSRPMVSLLSLVWAAGPVEVDMWVWEGGLETNDERFAAQALERKGLLARHDVDCERLEMTAEGRAACRRLFA